MRKNATIDMASDFSEAIKVTESNNKLEEQIEKLETELEKRKGDIVDVKVDEIYPNKKQPRKSFYVVKELAQSIEKHDLKEPICLVQTDNKLVIFDGECRWRAVKSLGHETIKAIILPYNEESFDDDVLISSTHRNNLNSLDLAEAIVEKIKLKLPKLSGEDIARKLNTLLVRTKRQKKTNELLNEEWDSLELAEDEITITKTIIFYGWNPITISSHKFPLLKLPADLKKAIRDKGLNETCATVIAKINHLKINQINEKKAISLRKKIINNAVNNNLSVAKVKAEVKKLLEEINPSEAVEENQKILNSYYKVVKAIPVDKLSETEKKELLTEVLKLVNQLQLE